MKEQEPKETENGRKEEGMTQEEKAAVAMLIVLLVGTLCLLVRAVIAMLRQAELSF